jgi:hypothetical protein
MDLSKLPRLSKTDAGTSSIPVVPDPSVADAAAPPAVETSFCVRCAAPLRGGAKFCDNCGAPAGVDYTAPRLQADAAPGAGVGVGVEVWISAVIGLILMLMGRSFGAYLIAMLTGQPFHTHFTWGEGPKEGQEVGYWELSGFTALSDSAVFLFGLTMVLEAAVLALINTRFKAKAQLVTVALLFTVLVTAYNAVVALKLMTTGLLPITSLLAIAFGGYIAVFEWRLLQQLRPR